MNTAVHLLPALTILLWPVRLAAGAARRARRNTRAHRDRAGARLTTRHIARLGTDPLGCDADLRRIAHDTEAARTRFEQ